MFKKRQSVQQVEESNELAPKFDDNGSVSYTHLTLPTTSAV